MHRPHHLPALALAALLAAAPLAASAQTLTLGTRSGPDSIDPHFTASGTHAEALKHVFDTLVWSGDGLELEPRLAVSWKPIDATTWEFKLRPGVKFHDGSDFTAADVKFSIERIPMVAGPNPTTIYVRRVKETKIIDPLTLHIVTDGPAPVLPNDFIRLFIVSSKAAAGLTKESANEAFNSGKAAAGTGPYKYVSWTPKGDLVLDRWEGYWGPKEPWARHIRKEIPNDAARVAQLKAGQVDIITRVPATDVATLKTDSKLTVTTIPTVYVFNVELDMRDTPPAGQMSNKDGSPLAKNPLLDPRVREAIDLAIDRKTLADIAMEGLGTAGEPAGDAVDLRLQQGAARAQVRHRGGEEAARRCGLSRTASRSSSRSPTTACPATARSAPRSRRCWPASASTSPPTRNPRRCSSRRARAREFSMSMSGWGTLTGEAHYTLSSVAHSNDKDRRMGAFNVLGYKNPEMDKLLQDAATEMDEGKRRALAREGATSSC